MAQHRVRDGARVAKGRDSPSANCHRCKLHRQRARHSTQRVADVRIEQAQLRIRRRLSHTYPKRELEQPGHPRSWLGVPNVRLYATHH